MKQDSLTPAAVADAASHLAHAILAVQGSTELCLPSTMPRS